MGLGSHLFGVSANILDGSTDVSLPSLCNLVTTYSTVGDNSELKWR